MNKSSEILKLERLCLRCGKCRSVCPSFNIRRDEAYSSRGRIVIAKAKAQHKLLSDKTYQSSLEECLGCNACTAICPSGAAAERINNLAYLDLIAKLGLPWYKKVLLRGLLRRGKLLGSIAEWGSRIRVLTQRKTTIKASQSRLFPSSGSISQRYFSLPAPHSFYRKIPSWVPALNTEKVGTVVFFPGCGMRLIYPDTAWKAVRLLQNIGYKVLLPQLDTCCGRLALAHGDMDTFNYLANQLINLIETQNTTIVTPCASCAFTINNTYPQMGFKNLPPVKVLSQVLVETNRIWLANPDIPTPVTFHDPCHLRYGLGVTEPPRLILRQAFGEKYHEIEEPGACCGGAGSYHLSHYEISLALGERRAENISSTKAASVVTECPGCMMFLEEMALLLHAQWRVVHLADVIQSKRE